jgi:hypothetical protein
MTENPVALGRDSLTWRRRIGDSGPQLRQIASEALRSLVLIALALVLILVLFPAALRAASPG